MNSQCIQGNTTCVGLIGSPVAHSLSPLIHNHVYNALQLPFVYVPLSVKAGTVHAAIMGLRALSFAGANVTIPHKQAVLPYCDKLSALSQKTGTVNTLFFRNNLLHGTTTDFEGFLRALTHGKTDPHGKHIVILGNGGTARTFGFALALDNIPATLSFIGRDLAKVKTLCSEITHTTGFPVQGELFGTSHSNALLEQCTLLVNCTSVGMHPHVSASPLAANQLHKGMIVFDTIYNPGETLLCSHARKAGCTVQSGLRMLVYQALASCSYWLDRTVQDDIIDFNELETIVSSTAGLKKGTV